MKLDNTKDGWKSTHAKYIYAFIAGAVVASLVVQPTPRSVEVVKKVPVTHTITKTPEACKRALEIDNQIFVKLGTGLGDLTQLSDANDYMSRHIDERTLKYRQCVES